MPCSSASIVSSTSYLSQSSAVGATTLFTPSAEGLYRITIAATFTNNSTVLFSMIWGLQGTQTENYTNTFNYQGTGVVFSFLGQASTAVQISMGAIAGSGTYDMFVTVEQLQ